MIKTMHAPINEGGFNCNVSFAEDTVTKVTKRIYTTEVATYHCGNLMLYGVMLAGEPLSTPSIYSVGSIAEAGGHRIIHTQQRIQGTPLKSLPEPERPTAVAATLQQFANMSIIAPDKLRTPIDAVPRNIIVDAAGTPWLVDLFPPLIRQADGSFIYNAQRMGRRNWEWRLGTISGVTTNLLQRLVDPGTHPKRLARLVTRSENWCYDVLPANMAPRTRDIVRANIALRFAPHMAGLAMARL